MSERAVVAALRGHVAEVFPRVGFGVRGPRDAALVTRPRADVLAGARAKFGMTWAPRPFAACLLCGAPLEPAPDPPTRLGLDGRGDPLFPLDTRAGALFLLSWLARAAAAHGDCQK